MEKYSRQESHAWDSLLGVTEDLCGIRENDKIEDPLYLQAINLIHETPV